MKKSKPVVLLILDGLGLSDIDKGNAVRMAETPVLKDIWTKYPHTQLQASGNYVGLPEGVQGNSEVGHMALGAGRIIFQEIARINHEIQTKEFFKNETFKEAIKHAKKNKGKFHLMGLLSDGSVHSTINHLFESLEFCKKEGLRGDDVIIHSFTDGRDTPPESAAKFLEGLERYIKKAKIGKISTIIGRYYAMDRDGRWDRVQLAYDLMTQGKGQEFRSWKEAIDNSYKADIKDEFIKPAIIVDKDGNKEIIKPGDSLVFYNYRADRAVQISKAFEDKNFQGFKREFIDNLYFAGFSNYEKGIPMNRAEEDTDKPGGERQFVQELFKEELKKTDQFPANQIFPPERVDKSLGKIISDAGLSQLRLAESEKFPHVTYFFSGRQKDPFKREDRVEVPSPRDVATYDLKPEMSTYQITDELEKSINSGKHDFLLVNFALTDMVAHTGNLKASIKAVEVADECTGKLIQTTLEKGGEVLLTADHGNIEELINIKTGDVDTKHSTNPVPFAFISNDTEKKSLAPGILADIGPTLMKRLGIDLPAEMSGRDLLA